MRIFEKVHSDLHVRFVAKMKTEACRGPKQVPSYFRQRIPPSNQWLRALEKDKRGKVVSEA